MVLYVEMRCGNPIEKLHVDSLSLFSKDEIKRIVQKTVDVGREGGVLRFENDSLGLEYRTSFISALNGNTVNHSSSVGSCRLDGRSSAGNAHRRIADMKKCT